MLIVAIVIMSKRGIQMTLSSNIFIRQLSTFNITCDWSTNFLDSFELCFFIVDFEQVNISGIYILRRTQDKWVIVEVSEQLKPSSAFGSYLSMKQ